VSCAGTALVSSALTGLAGTTGSIRVRAGREPAWAGTRSTGMVSAGTVAVGTVSAGTVVSGASGISSMSRIPDATDAIRPSAAAATNTITTPSAVKKPSCSMIRMYTVAPAGDPPMGTWLFHSGLSTGPRVNQAPAAAASRAPNIAMCLPLAIISRKPPRNTAAPGSSSSHSRPVL